MDYLNRFLEKLGYFDIIDDEDRIEAFVQNLNEDQFKNLIVTLNGKLREISRSEKGTKEEGYMMAGGWFSPSVEVNQELFPILLEEVKRCDNNHDRACLLYYSLLEMHPFEDGNGRTSRLIYDLVNGSYDYENQDNYYFHDENNNRQYKELFTTKRGIMDIDSFDYYSSVTLVDVLDKYGVELDDRMKGKSITTYGTGIVGDIALEAVEARKDYLTKDEIDTISVNLSDETGYYSVGGMIMTIMATKNGNIDEWIKREDARTERLKNLYDFSQDEETLEERQSRFIFYLDDNKELFDNWTNDDFRTVIPLGNDIKKQQIINSMKVFTEENYCIVGDTPLKEMVNTSNEAMKIA